MPSTKTLENLARRLPPWAARTAKRMVVGRRYARQAAACREGYREYGDRYPNPVLFVAGLPKSGTTWLERMISSYPGYHDLLIPDVARWELSTGGSHDYDLPADMFSRFRDMLVLTKMHVHGSEHNARVLREAGVPYVVLYRDVRDVAISHFYYVRQTPWHPEYPDYESRSLTDGLQLFSERMLPEYAKWVRSWHERCDPERGFITRYEDLLADTHGTMTRIASHFGLDDSKERIDELVDAHSFKRMSKGREQGEGSEKSFFRKGVAGDWKNQFTPELRQTYKDLVGDFLIEFGFEQDLDW